jgi:hypothetical protein
MCVTEIGQAELEEKSICGNGKGARALPGFVLAWNSDLRDLGNEIDLFKRFRRCIMRVCPNINCVACGRIVFSVATRCPLCRWDLKVALPASETAPLTKPDRQLPVR